MIKGRLYSSNETEDTPNVNFYVLLGAPQVYWWF